MNSLVSVVIPIFNREHLILDTINSVLAQTYQNFEIILVDDGSVDNTKQVISSINDSRIKYIYQNNAGPSAARNNGIRHAKGEYIAFLDSDDLWLPEKLEKQISVLNNNKNIGIISCWSQCITYDGEKLHMRMCKAKDSKEFCLKILLQPDTVVTGSPTMIVRKECFNKVGYFDEKMKTREDWDMWFRISNKYEFYCINEILTHIKVSHESLSKVADIIGISDNYLRFLENVYNNKNIPKEIIKLKNYIYSNTYWNIGYSALYRGNMQLRNMSFARENLLTSLKYSKTRIFKPNFFIALLTTYLPVNLANKCCNIKNSIKSFIKIHSKKKRSGNINNEKD